MAGYTHLLQNPSITGMAERAGPEITGAIHKASAKTGADFAYLMEKASAESSFRPDVQAKTSSATGLFQFIDSTWLRMINNYGDRHGLGHYAEMIDSNGKVSSAKDKQMILNLRNDPEVSALMAAEFASENKRILESRLDLAPDDIGATELYLAHFLGAGGASTFVGAMKDNSHQGAASLMPNAARANKAIFYNADGSERSLKQIYEHFDKKFSHPESSEITITKHNEKDVSPDINDPGSLPAKSNPTHYQKAFIPHQHNFDDAVIRLLLSDLGTDTSSSYINTSFHGQPGSLLNLLDISAFLSN